MPRIQREIERKLEVPPRFRLPALEGAGSGIGSASALPTIRLKAEYYDTADLRLARNRITLRRRTGGGDAGWHLKLPHDDEVTRDDTSRDEVQLPLNAHGAPPPELVALVLGVTRGTSLAPVVILRTERRPIAITDENGRPLAEVTDDRVTVIADSTVVGRFRELEVEAAGDRTARDLDPIVAALVAAGATESGFASKAARALGPRAAEPPDVEPPRPVRPEAPAGDAIAALLALHVSAFLREDLRLRRNLPDAVHQMRVAARRIRSSLKVFAPLVDTDWSNSLTAELKWIADELGAARDIEVMEHRLLAGLAALPDADTTKAAAVVRRRLTAEEATAQGRAAAAMESDRYLTLLDALVSGARSPQLTTAAQEASATALPPLMRAAWKRLAKEVKTLRMGSPDHPWHEARIRAKHARYAAEALAPVFGKPARRLARQLSGVTELLGAHQDAAVAAEAARVLATSKGVGGQAGYVLGLLHDQQRAEIRSLRRAFQKRWPKAAAPKWRRWLRTGAAQ